MIPLHVCGEAVSVLGKAVMILGIGDFKCPLQISSTRKPQISCFSLGWRCHSITLTPPPNARLDSDGNGSLFYLAVGRHKKCLQNLGVEFSRWANKCLWARYHRPLVPAGTLLPSFHLLPRPFHTLFSLHPRFFR
jgi:hypothetical protein